MRKPSRGGAQKPSLALRAAALQQHMSQKMFLSEPLYKPNIPKTTISRQKPKRKHPNVTKPSVPTSTIFESKSVSYKRKIYNQKLTLAEQLGLVKPPPAPLTDEQFETVKINTQKRGFFNECCPICLEKFGPDNLVLLSCSHLLHTTCLMNFRKFTRGKVHTCPVCRCQYEFVEVKAEAAYHDRCARDIQRVFRGYLVRDKICRNAPVNSILHRKWVIGKAQDVSHRLTKAIDSQNDAVDAFLSSIDADLEYQRGLLKAFEEREKTVNFNVCRKKAVEINEEMECPICLRKIETEECEVTSCCHVFHINCLMSWLNFCENQGKQGTCPVCRSVFQHAHFVEKDEHNNRETNDDEKEVKQKTKRGREKSNKRIGQK
ncbi:RING finger protein 32 isoform X1 [Histomonas meleagridis]|uniref:RING finger protein 32 isoform X1 n=1 Tax=Histomonas meleagridis TaxID=135588 RepID=UPI00355A53E4|nr:RING finger protein 32 isoform X1 [Histomonas meleagridis]KAH0802414.1 RING finger protein 32 isoform X1 [Histomonas meleagridis]